MWIAQYSLLSCLSVVILGYLPSQDLRCYDCHYDPDSDKYRQASWGQYPGYPKCSMYDSVEQGHVDRWKCKTGKCFIRKDPNGLLYRGCADPANLPWAVDTSQNCQYQGQIPSLWYFCDGDLCNGGRLGAADICPDHYDNEDDAIYVETVHGPGEGGLYEDDTEYFLDDENGYKMAGNEHSGSVNQQLLPFIDDTRQGVDFEFYSEQYMKQNTDQVPDQLGSYQTGDMRYLKLNGKPQDIYKSNAQRKSQYMPPSKATPVKNYSPSKKSYILPEKSYTPPQKQPNPPSEKSYGPPSKSLYQQRKKPSYIPAPQKTGYTAPVKKSPKSEPLPKPVHMPPPQKPAPLQPMFKPVENPPSEKPVIAPPQTKSAYVEPTKKSVYAPPKNSGTSSVKKPPSLGLKSMQQKSVHHVYGYQPAHYKSQQPKHKSPAKPQPKPKLQPQPKPQPVPKPQPKLKQKFQPSVNKKSEQPHHKSQQIHYKSEQHYKPEQPPYKFEQTHYKSEQPHYKSEQPHYKSEQPHYKSQQQNPKSEQPNYKSEQPHYKSEQPHYKSEQPHYKSQQENHKSEQPHYKSEQPHYKSEQPRYKSEKSYVDKTMTSYGFDSDSITRTEHEKYPLEMYMSQNNYRQQQPVGSYLGVAKSGDEDQSEDDNKYGINDKFMGSPDRQEYPALINDHQGYGYGNGNQADAYDNQDNEGQTDNAYMGTNVKKIKLFAIKNTMTGAMQEAYSYLDQHDGSPYNPCDGRCHNNPSGLFPDPADDARFIQCGDGMELGKACRCCKPYFLKCPPDTTFDDVTRVCIKASARFYT